MTHSGLVQRILTWKRNAVLIPLLLDDPLWEALDNLKQHCASVLIPLLLDDPLWVFTKKQNHFFVKVLIPLLLDDPLWAWRYG